MKNFMLYLLLLALNYAESRFLGNSITSTVVDNNERDRVPTMENENYWYQKAQISILSKLTTKLNKGIAKNVILFLGDGMSIATLAASRVYMGNQLNVTGENLELSFEKFPHVGLSKTYCVDRTVTDSASSATAYLCGVKANYGTIGVTADVRLDECLRSLDPNNRVESIARWSQLAGKRTGIVTTTRVTHASPAGAYAKTANRQWESDQELSQNPIAYRNCLDIAYQLIYGETGRNFNVILGGGRSYFVPSSGLQNSTGRRLDGRNLIEEWKMMTNGEYVENKNELLNIPPDTQHLFGLFADSHLDYYLDSNNDDQPTLADMTRSAIEVLSKGDKGYFLFVEGGRIDHAHHETRAQKAFGETLQFSEAIKLAEELTNEEETLIVVTSDHSHTMTLNGYPKRGANIFGFADRDSDKLPYTTISYANGPGFKRSSDTCQRYDISGDPTGDKEYQFPSTVPLESETHGGDDVAIFAKGPWSHLFTGVNEQNVIAHNMAFASCVGYGLTVCKIYDYFH